MEFGRTIKIFSWTLLMREFLVSRVQVTSGHPLHKRMLCVPGDAERNGDVNPEEMDWFYPPCGFLYESSISTQQYVTDQDDALKQGRKEGSNITQQWTKEHYHRKPINFIFSVVMSAARITVRVTVAQQSMTDSECTQLFSLKIMMDVLRSGCVLDDYPVMPSTQ